MRRLPGYRVHELVHRGRSFTVHRGVRDADGAKVILKVTADDHPSLGEITRLKQEYELASMLDIPGVVRCHALERHGNGYALVMRDVGAVSLQEIAGGAPMDLSVFLTIAVRLAGTLEAIHARGIVHKDIKPTNVVATRDGGVVEIIDFGAASLLSNEHRRSAPASRRIEGTLTHVSPEQTGRIHRSVDHRSDLYSLGITFYELLTGRLPFRSDDALEMLHFHLAEIPPAPSCVEPAVPEALSAIVMKLMAKTPEERYRGAAGLKEDLERCLAALARGEQVDVASLGTADGRGVFQIPQRLYGREAEVAHLLSVLDRVCEAGPAEMLLISGYSGIGKSSLVHEVHRPILARRGSYVSGKFDQLRSNVPYASFVQAFRALIQQVLAEDAQVIAERRRRLQGALGENGRLIVDVIPELELVIGPQPEPPKLTGADAQRRFNDTFRSFLRVFASRRHPLVIFLDDLQWADAGTLGLVHTLMTDAEMRYLLLLGAYRDNEVTPHHPMRVMVEQVQAAAKGRVSEVVLGPFTKSDLGQLVGDTLCCRPDEAASLVALVMEKTHGNPFFVGQLLRSLHDEGLLRFGPEAGRWAWDIDAIRARGISENVVDLMSARIRKLDADTQAALKMAACIGDTFDLKTLAFVLGKSSKATAADLWRALEESLVSPVSDTYKIARLHDLDTLEDADIRLLAERTRYRFLHDRIQQAAYSLIPADQVKSTHLRIGRLWLASAGATELGDDLFDVVGHLDAGMELVTDRAELYRLIELNTAAARKARAASAFGAARQLMTTARSRLPETAWEESYKVALECTLESAETELFVGRYREALAALHPAKRHVTDVLERCRICELEVLAHRMLNDLDAAFETGASMLAVLGVRLDLAPDAELLRAELARTARAVGERRAEDLARQPEMTDPRQLAACRILQEIWPVAFFLGSLSMHVAAMKIVQISAEHGNTSCSVFGYMVYAFAQVYFFEDVESGYAMGLVSLDMHRRVPSRDVETKVLDMWGGLLQHYKEPVRACRETLLRGFTCGMEAGDYQWAGYCTGNYSFQCLLGDVSLRETVAAIERFLPALRGYHQNITYVQLVLREATASLMDDKDDPVRFAGAFCDEDTVFEFGRRTSDLNILFILSFCKLCVAIFLGESEALFALQAEAERNIGGAGGIWAIPMFHFLQSVALLQLHDTAAPGDRAAYLATVRRNLGLLERRAAHCPESFAHLCLLVRAELARIEERFDAAIGLYEEAITQAQEHDFTWAKALSCERAFRFYQGRGVRTVASAYLKDARHAYSLWGADAKVRRLDLAHPEVLAEPRRGSSQSTSEDIDVLAVTHASQAISGELSFRPFLETLMRIVTASAGAQTGFLLLARDDGQLFIEAASPPPEGVSLPVAAERGGLVPGQVVRYVARARTPVFLDDAARGTGPFSEDEYILRHAPRSVLCLPIPRRGDLTALLYLENRLIARAFTPDKVKVLEMLAAQAAISLENARLYDDVEQKVAQRTRELREAQSRIVALEKDATEAQMAGGFAHEMRNALAGARMLLQAAIGASQRGDAALCSEASRQLRDLYTGAAPGLAGDQLAAVRSGARALNQTHRQIDDVLRRVEEAVARGLSITSDVLSYAAMRREERGEVSVRLRPVAEALALDLGSSGVRFELEVPADVAVRGKPEHVRSILENLVRNACDAVAEATPHGGGRIHIAAIAASGEVTLTVEDNGAGMTADVQARIFEPFFSTKPTSGIGLGLGVVRKLVSLYDGRIAVESTVGRGTCFTVTLPDDPSPRGAPRQGATA